jgi:hypothetical protein
VKTGNPHIDAAVAAGRVTLAVGPAARVGGRTAAKYTEREFQRDVLELARAHGWRRAHFAPARVRRGGKESYETPVRGDGRGFPDVILVREVVIVAELKTDTGRLTEDQRQWLAAFRAAGIAASVWRPRDMDLIRKALT